MFSFGLYDMVVLKYNYCIYTWYWREFSGININKTNEVKFKFLFPFQKPTYRNAID